jgi:hypothetical protein
MRFTDQMIVSDDSERKGDTVKQRLWERGEVKWGCEACVKQNTCDWVSYDILFLAILWRLISQKLKRL